MTVKGKVFSRIVFACLLLTCCWFGVNGVDFWGRATHATSPSKPTQKADTKATKQASSAPKLAKAVAKRADTSAEKRRPSFFAKTPKYVFLISIDGWAFRHLWSKKLSMPHIRKLAKMGVWGDSRTVFPSMTWPSHASIVTGVFPRRHGVLGNRWFAGHKNIMLPYWDNIEKKRDTPTLYDLAHEAGMKPAAVMWPGTQGSKTLSYNLPELTRTWLIRRYVKGKMKRLIARSPRYSYRSLPRTMRGENAATDKMVSHLTQRLLRKPAGQRPTFYMIHFLDIDHAQHHWGTGYGRGLKRAARSVDDRVGEIIAAVKKAGIFRQSAFFFASDHGFLQVKRCIDARNVLLRAGLSRRYSLNSKTASRERVVAFPNGHAAFIYLKKKRGAKGFAALRHRVVKLFKKIKEVESVLLPHSYATVGLPTPKQDRGSPDLIILSKPHAYFGYNSRGRIVTNSGVGAHGYLPNHPDMWVPFVAVGAGIRPSGQTPGAKAGRLSVHNVDIAPTIAHLMGLSWPERPDGRVIHEIIEPTARPILLARLKKHRQERKRRARLARAKKEKLERQAN